MKGRVLAMCCSVNNSSVLLQLKIVPFHSSTSIIWVMRGVSCKTSRAEAKGYEFKKNQILSKCWHPKKNLEKKKVERRIGRFQLRLVKMLLLLQLYYLLLQIAKRRNVFSFLLSSPQINVDLLHFLPVK